jgi:hypothetical protein
MTDAANKKQKQKKK